MINIHFIMMGKGGIGKSTTAVILAQNLKAKDEDLCCADLDPTNATFSAYQALNAEHINIADKNLILTRRSSTFYWKRCLRQKTSGLSIRAPLPPAIDEVPD